MTILEKMLEALQAHSKLDPDTYHDISSHGADAGFCGYIYYDECAEFYDDNEELIYDLLNETADNLGHSNIEEMVSTFGRADLLATPTGRKNLLTWFALESVAHAVADGSLTVKVPEEV